jgi:hypothetical protein
MTADFSVSSTRAQILYPSLKYPVSPDTVIGRKQRMT